MTITTTQFQVVQTAVNTIMEGKDFQWLFAPIGELTDFQIDTWDNIVEAFELPSNYDNDDLEIAIDTLEKVANNIVDYYDMNVFSELCDYHDFFEALEIVENESLVLHGDVFEMSEIAENYVNECGMPSNCEFYFDEERLKCDLYNGGDIQDYYYNLVKEDSLYQGMSEEEAEKLANDYEITDQDENEYVELIVECASDEFKQRYFDFEALGRDMDIEGYFYTCDSGIIEVTY